MMKISFAIVIMVSALSACVTTGGRMKGQFMFQEEMSDMRESVSRGSLPQAVQNLSMLLEMDRDNRDARGLRAVAYQKLGRFDMAVDDYKLLLSKYPDDAKANYNLGMIYAFKLVDKREALRHLDKFLTLDIKSTKAFEVAKLMCSIEGSIQSLKSNGNEVFSKWSYEKAINEKDDKTRKNLLMDSVSLDPSQKGAYLELAGDLEAKGDNGSAIKHYNMAIEASPTFSEAHYRLGQLLLEECRKEEAYIHLMKASLFAPNDPRYSGVPGIP